MICPKCKADMPDGYAFCLNCGTALSAPVSRMTGTTTTSATPPAGGYYGPTGGLEMPRKATKKLSPKAKKIILFSAIGAAVIIAVILALVLIPSSAKCKTPQALIGKYYDAVFDKDSELLLKLADEDLTNSKNEYFNGSKSDNEIEAERYIEDYLDEWDGKVKYVSHKIVEESDWDKDEVDFVNEFFGETDYDKKIQEIKFFEVEVTVKVNGEKKTYTDYLNVAKIGDYWYLYNEI